MKKAGDEDEIGQIINSSIKEFPENNLFRYLGITYLHILQNELQMFAGPTVDSSGKDNVLYPLNYLKQMNNNRAKQNK